MADKIINEIADKVADKKVNKTIDSIVDDIAVCIASNIAVVSNKVNISNKINKTTFTKYVIKYTVLFITILNLIFFDIQVYADNPPTFTIEENIQLDNLTAIVSFTPGQCAAGTIKLNFNTDVLEFLSVEKMENQIQVVNVNYIEESGLIAVNFFNTEGLVSGNTNLAEVKFKIKGDSFSKEDIGIDNFKLYDSNSELLASNDNVAANFKLNAEGISKNIKVIGNVDDNSENIKVIENAGDNSENTTVIENADDISDNINVIEKTDDESDYERKSSKDSVRNNAKNNETEKTSDEENKSELPDDSESSLANDSQEERSDSDMTEDSDIDDNNNSDSLNTENITNHLEQGNEKKKNQSGRMIFIIIIALIIGAGIVLVRSVGKNRKRWV